MSREIKFRGPDAETGELIDDFLYEINLNVGYAYYRDSADNAQRCKVSSLMQYTGHKDKNGVEIYEGDVVETDFPSFPKGFVKYSAHTCAYVLATEGSTVFFISDLVRNKWKLAVIGNIHEHKELLNS